MENETMNSAAQVLEEIQSNSEIIRQNLSNTIVGQKRVVEQVILSLVTGGHVLIEGVPGLAKTTLIASIAQSSGLGHGRIQFTPDLLPSDIIGSEILQEDHANGSKSLKYEKGPVFTQVLLADEINRTPPKTQSALLQAMQERKVSVGGQTYDLPFPFLVYATQNPIENEGTYPLPEAQLDRFMLKLVVEYPELEDERKIAVMSPRELPHSAEVKPLEINWQTWYQFLDAMPVAETIIDAAVNIVRASRPRTREEDEYIHQNVRWGAGPRASQFLLLAAKGLAAISGQATPNIQHLKDVAIPVLRHRIIPSFSAEAAHISSEQIITYLLDKYLHT